MKNVNPFVLIIFCFVMQRSFAQEIYYVLNVKGNVKLEKTKGPLKVNDQISDKDGVLFSSVTDAVAVISSKNGRMILRPKPTAKSSELMCVVSDILNPGTGRLSARAGSITNIIELKNYFGKDTLHILGAGRVWISPTAYPMNSANLFFVRYTWKGETINKRLSFEKDSLILSAGEIYKVDGSSISPKEVKDAKLFYKQGSSVSEIGPFTISFPDEAALKQIVASFKDHTSFKGKQFLDEMTPLLRDIYGRTDADNVRSWVHKNVTLH